MLAKYQQLFVFVFICKQSAYNGHQVICQERLDCHCSSPLTASTLYNIIEGKLLEEVTYSDDPSARFLEHIKTPHAHG